MINKMTRSMLVIGALLLLASTGVYAGEHHGANALEHAAVAASHGEKGHNQLVLEHSKEALHHAKMAAQIHHNRHMHTMKAIEQLDAAIKNANKGKSEQASKSAHKAVEHLHRSFE